LPIADSASGWYYSASGSGWQENEQITNQQIANQQEEQGIPDAGFPAKCSASGALTPPNALD
jgi:hypothetical protein